MTTTTSLADAKARFSQIVASAESTHERTIVTKNGRPVAVVISLEDLESLEQTLDILSDPDAMGDLAESRISFEHGYFYCLGETDADVERRMGQQAYADARAAVRAELLAAGDDERARHYEPV